MPKNILSSKDEQRILQKWILKSFFEHRSRNINKMKYSFNFVKNKINFKFDWRKEEKKRKREKGRINDSKKEKIDRKIDR